MSQNNSYIVYDGECPFCSRYVKFLRLKESLGSVELIDARSNHQVVKEIIAKGYDLDEGMVFKNGSKIYHGDECVYRLSLLSTPSTLFNKVNAIVFRSKTLSKILYPALRVGRNITLRILGRKKIANA